MVATLLVSMGLTWYLGGNTCVNYAITWFGVPSVGLMVVSIQVRPLRLHRTIPHLTMPHLTMQEVAPCEARPRGWQLRCRPSPVLLLCMSLGPYAPARPAWPLLPRSPVHTVLVFCSCCQFAWSRVVVPACS